MSRKEVAEFFDCYSNRFNAIYGNKESVLNGAVNRLFRKSMRLRFEHTLRGCQPIEGRSVIDIGCGPGHYSIRLAKMGAQRTLGLDFAAGMVEIAKENAERAGVGNRCKLLLYTADHLKRLFAGRKCRKFEIQKISRDFFVTVSLA